MKPQDVAAYCFLAIAWGLSFLVLVNVVEAFGWVGAVSLRGFVAGGTLLLIARIIRHRLDFSAGWRHFAMVGATTVAIQLLGLSWATPLIGTALAAILVATIPLFSMLIGHVWGHERLQPSGVLGLLAGAAGLVLLVGFPAEPLTALLAAGIAASLVSAFAAAFGSNYVSRHLAGVGPLEVTSAAFLAGGLMTLPLLAVVPVPGPPRAVDFLYLVTAGSLMSALTYVLYFRLVTRIGATRAISVEFAVTLVAVLVGALALGERITPVQIGAAGLILLGCALVLGLVNRGKAGLQH